MNGILENYQLAQAQADAGAKEFDKDTEKFDNSTVKNDCWAAVLVV